MRISVFPEDGWPFAALFDSLPFKRSTVPTMLPEIVRQSSNQGDLSKLHLPLQGASRYPRGPPVRDEAFRHDIKFYEEDVNSRVKATARGHDKRQKSKVARRLKLIKDRLRAAGDEFPHCRMSSVNGTQEVVFDWVERRRPQYQMATRGTHATGLEPPVGFALPDDVGETENAQFFQRYL